MNNGSASVLTRRSALVRLAGGLACLSAPAHGVGAADTTATSGRELFLDPTFSRGFRLCEPEPGKRVVYGALRGFSPEPPAWDLDQWSSRHRLAAEAPGPGAGPEGAGSDRAVVRRWENPGKVVVLRRAGSDEARRLGELELTVRGNTEYNGRARRDGEPWVHLLVEQAISGAPTLAELRGARFRIQAQKVSSHLVRTEDYSPSRHAAQFQAFLAVQNVRSGSPGQGRLVWFGIPLYDDRHRVPPEHKTRDTGGTGMFIFTPRGDVYTRQSAHDGEWITVDHNLVPLLREALETAWSRGFLTESREFSDYRITSLNLGWEVPGLLDVTMRVRGLSLVVT